MAAYIDLNPVRAGLVKEPEEYRWCGYGEAVLGVKEAMDGLGFVAELLGLDPAEGSEKDVKDVKARNSWNQAVLARYRVWLYGEGQEILAVDGKGGRVGFTLEEIEAVRVSGGVLSLPQRLRLKVRHFTDGGAVGSKGFVDAVFGMWRERFGKNRKTGARKMRGADWGELRALRDLQR
jgi:hypothetical protein